MSRRRRLAREIKVENLTALPYCSRESWRRSLYSTTTRGGLRADAVEKGKLQTTTEGSRLTVGKE